MTSFTRLFRRPKKKGFSSGEDTHGGANEKKRAKLSERTLQFDLFSQLSYMSAVATAGVTRAQLFSYASELPYASAQYFKQVHTLAQKLNIDYAEGCRMVAEVAKRYEVKGLLLRLSGALSSGEDEADFLRREAEIAGETYSNQYERDIESLKKWSDAYVTLLVASGLIVIVAVISMMIYEVGVAIIIGLAMTMVFATCFGAWIIHAGAPREIKTRVTGSSSRLQLLAARAFRITVPLAFATSSTMVFVGMDLGAILIVSGVILLPVGLIISRDDRNITRKDEDIATMTRVLGGVTSALNTTVTEALAKVDRRSMGALMHEATRLRHRLTAGIAPDLCWSALVDECGSELIDRTVKMFWHPISLGGRPDDVGTASSLFASRMAFLRASRAMTASTFRWLTIPMHLAMVGLLEFIVEIMGLFTIGINQASSGLEDLGDIPESLSVDELFTFGQINLELVDFLVTFVILVLTAANAFAPKAASGGHSYKVVYNLSISMFITGAVMLSVPVLAGSIFESIIER